MASLIPGAASINWMGGLSQVVYWLFWILLAGFVVVAVFGIYYYLSFNIKATVFTLFGSGKDGVFSIGKQKKNRIKITKGGNVWKSLFPLFNKKLREPFDAEYIYPGKRIYVFDLNGEWFPGRVNIHQTEQQIRAEINPIPYWVRNWADAESRIDESEFSQMNWWSENKMFVYMLISIGICCLLCGATIYFTYKFAVGGTEKINIMTQAIQGISGQVAPPG